jgi:hypothetical protein
VLLLEETKKIGVWNVAQLYHDVRLISNGSIALGAGFGFAEAWNCYDVDIDLLELFIGSVADSLASEVLSISKQFFPFGGCCILIYFKELESSIGSYVKNKSESLANIKSNIVEQRELLSGITAIIESAKKHILRIDRAAIDIIQVACGLRPRPEPLRRSAIKHSLKIPAYDSDGYDSSGYDRDGYDRNGYNCRNFNKNGNHLITGNKYDANGFDNDGFDIDSYDMNGYNKFGYDRSGYDMNGFNIDRIHRDTKSFFDNNGYDVNGYDKDGYNRYNIDIHDNEKKEILCYEDIIFLRKYFYLMPYDIYNYPEGYKIFMRMSDSYEIIQEMPAISLAVNGEHIIDAMWEDWGTKTPSIKFSYPVEIHIVNIRIDCMEFEITF